MGVGYDTGCYFMLFLLYVESVLKSVESVIHCVERKVRYFQKKCKKRLNSLNMVLKVKSLV